MLVAEKVDAALRATCHVPNGDHLRLRVKTQQHDKSPRPGPRGFRLKARYPLRVNWGYRAQRWERMASVSEQASWVQIPGQYLNHNQEALIANP